MLKTLLAVLLALAASTATAELASLKTISQAVEKHFIDLDRNDVPGCAVGYARDGKLIYQSQFGMANLEHDITIDATTVFRIGSTLSLIHI